MSAIEDLAEYIYARMPSETPEGERTTWDDLAEQQRDVYRAHARNAALTFPDQYPAAATEAFAAVSPDDDLITRAKYCRRYGDWDRMKSELLAEVERLRGALESIGRLTDTWSESVAAKDGVTVDILNALFAVSIRDVLRGDQ